MNSAIGVHRISRLAATILCTLCAPALHAQTATSGPHRPAHDDRIAERMQTLSEPDLKSLYRRCLNASLRGMLSTPEIALCSTASEVLLKRVFSGDFDALVAWSKHQRDDSVHDAADRYTAGPGGR